MLIIMKQLPDLVGGAHARGLSLRLELLFWFILCIISIISKCVNVGLFNAATQLAYILGREVRILKLQLLANIVISNTHRPTAWLVTRTSSILPITSKTFVI